MDFSKWKSAALAIFVSTGISASDPPEPMELIIQLQQDPIDLEYGVLESKLQEYDKHVLRHQIVRINLDALDTDHRTRLAENTSESGGWAIGNSVKFTAFEGTTLILRNTDIREIGDEPVEDYFDWWSWIGVVDTLDKSFATFVIANNQIQHGEIHRSGYGLIEISPISNGYYLIKEMLPPYEQWLRRTDESEAEPDFKVSPNDEKPRLEDSLSTSPSNANKASLLKEEIRKLVSPHWFSESPDTEPLEFLR